MAILPLLQKLSFHVPGLSEKKRKNMERRLAFHEWTKGFRRFFRRPFVFLFGSPFHSNLGDQAQTECIIAWIRKNLPRHEIFIATYMNTSPRLLKMIRRHIRKNDILLCHSGYHMTDLYNEQSHYLRIAQLFPDHPLTILPQTIHYQDDSHAQATADILNSHPDCTLLCRDEHSYETARALFNKCRLFLYPDIVTSLIGNIKLPEYSRKGVLFCMRNDKEAGRKPLNSSAGNWKSLSQRSKRTLPSIFLPAKSLRTERKYSIPPLIISPASRLSSRTATTGPSSP